MKFLTLLHFVVVSAVQIFFLIVGHLCQACNEAFLCIFNNLCIFLLQIL